MSFGFSGKQIHSMVAHLDAVTSLAVDPNGLYLLSGSKCCPVVLIRHQFALLGTFLSDVNSLILIVLKHQSQPGYFDDTCALKHDGKIRLPR